MKLRLIGGPKDGEVIDAPDFFSKKDTNDNCITYLIHRINGEFVGVFKEAEDDV